MEQKINSHQRSTYFRVSNSDNTPISPSTGNQPDTCQSAQNSYSPSGLSLKVVYRPRSGQKFFSGLFSFPEETVECPADVFMNLDNSLRLQGLSLYMNMGCPWLTLGQLTVHRHGPFLVLSWSTRFRPVLH